MWLSSQINCVVLFSVLIMLIVFDYAALNVLAVNVAFVVGLLSFTGPLGAMLSDNS